MNSKAYFDANGKLVVPLVPPVQESECFREYASASALLPNDVSYENLSAYIARLSHLNPNLVTGSLRSPISNQITNSGPSVGGSSLITDATYGANFQRTSSINIESYQNLASSPISVSSRNMSGLAVEPASPTQLTGSHLNQFNEVARKMGRPNHDTSSLFLGKERELVDYLPQKSKKPRLDAAAENALHQYITQQLLQKQEPLVLQNYNQQLNAFLQQHNLQKLKQKEVPQLLPQYVGAPMQQQMRHYLQQLANRSVPAIRPLPSGICSQRLMQFIYHFQDRPSDNSITYWRKFVAEYYAPCAKKRWCLSLYNGVGERALGVLSQLTMEAWRCDLCGSNSGKGFEATFELLPRLYKSYFESGVLDELLFLDLPHEYILPSGLISLRYDKAVQETIYEKIRVVREGQLRIIFRNDLKILAWEFCARCHDEVVPRSLVAPQVNELVQAAEKCQREGESNGVAVQKLQSTCKMFVAAEGQLMRNLNSLLVNDLGFPKRYIRCLQIAEIVNNMKDLMTFSLGNNVGPIESLARYSREGSKRSNTQKQPGGIPATSEALLSGSKQVAYGGMSSHQKMQYSTANSEKQRPPAWVYCSNPDADFTPLTDPKSSHQSLIQSSPVSGTSSSTLSEFDDKLQKQMIDKILQQMESNTREKAKLSNNVKVKVEATENLDRSPTAAVATRNRGTGRVGNGLDLGNTGSVVMKSVPPNGSKMGDSSKAATSNIYVKQEPDDEDIYKDLYLPEAIRDVDREFFQIGALNHVWNDIGWKGKNEFN